MSIETRKLTGWLLFVRKVFKAIFKTANETVPNEMKYNVKGCSTASGHQSRLVSVGITVSILLDR